MCLTILCIWILAQFKRFVVRKAIQKVISAMLKCGHYFTCGTDFNRVQLCLNNPKPKKCTLLCLHLHLFLHRRQEVSSIPFLHVVFQSLGCMYLGQRQSSELNQGLLHAWPQSEFSLCDQACSQLPRNGSWQGRGGVKKKTPSGNGHLAKFSQSEKLEPLRETNVWNC